MRVGNAASALTIVALSGACCAMAQDHGRPSEQPADSFLQRQREIDDKLRSERERVRPIDSFLDWQWGGSLDYYAFHFDDGLQKSRFYQRPGLNVWSRATIDNGAHEFFARMTLDYERFRGGDQYDRRIDWVGPNFDRAWYQLDVNKAFRFTSPGAPQAKVRIGRQQITFGTGYALDLPLDAVLVDAKYADVRTLVLIGRSIGSTPNIDRSEPVDSHMNRDFYGVQVSYEGWQNHVPFAYGLWQQDRTDERPRDLYQEYDYDSQYWGVGMRGELVKNLRYWAEGVVETGHSYGNGDFWRPQDEIEAYGWDAGLEYLFNTPLRPRISAEYMFASGDGDRLDSPTDAAGGNRRDRLDRSFVGFGFRDTGIAAAPVLSNMHVWRAGGSLTPFEKIEFLRDLEVGTNWFLYHKHHARGAISDTTAQQFDGFVGWEMDYFINWRIVSDVSWTVRWGAFFPGDAYQNQEARHFVFSGITWSF